MECLPLEDPDIERSKGNIVYLHFLLSKAGTATAVVQLSLERLQATGEHISTSGRAQSPAPAPKQVPKVNRFSGAQERVNLYSNFTHTLRAMCSLLLCVYSNNPVILLTSHAASSSFSPYCKNSSTGALKQ